MARRSWRVLLFFLSILSLIGPLSGQGRDLRADLENRGFTFELVYTGEGFWNTRGGIATHHARKYRGDVSLFMLFDTAQGGWWENGLFFSHVQHQHGEGITENYVGDFQVLSNIDADDFTQVSEIWYRHTFFDDVLWFKVGKQESNADFAYVDHGVEFMNSSPGFSPTIPLVTYPDQDWGVVVGLEPWDRLSMNAGVFQGRPDGGRSVKATVDHLYGPMVMVEPALHYQLGRRAGHLRVGGWWNGDRFDELDRDNPSPGTFGRSYGWYATLDQEVFMETPDEDGQGLGLFGQYGWAPGDRSEARQYIGGGIQWIGAIPSRDEDILGAGVFHVDFSRETGFARRGETVCELFYKVKVLDFLSFKPDMQYIVHPGGTTNDNALTVGLRMELTF